MFHATYKFLRHVACAVIGFYSILSLASVPAEGAQITGLTAEWSVVDTAPDGATLETSNAAPGVAGNAASIFWGTPPWWSQQSGYEFDPISSIPVTPGEEFTLGQFTHFNYPIYEPLLEQATLSLTGSLDDNPFDLKFTVNHNETPNVGWRCCDDLVSIGEQPDFPLDFAINGSQYILTILGFEVYGGYPLNPIFATHEKKTNIASIKAVISPVPLPAALPLFGAGLGILGFVGWRRRRQKMSRKTSA